jgi:CHAT domain-containing protein
MNEKIKILFLAANPIDIHPLRLGEEAREIESEIQAAALRERFELETKWAVRPDDLQKALLRFEPHIVHFSGHGSKNSEIVLEDADGASRPVSQQALSNLFKALKDNVRIVVLNSCYSQPQAEALSELIDFAIGTTQAVKDRSAVAFAAAFYRALAYGRSVQTAFDLAQNAIELKGLSGADIPVLKTRQTADAEKPLLLKAAASESAESRTTINNNFANGGAAFNESVTIQGDFISGGKKSS